jgi:short-subunit dehydrogenase
VTALVVGASSGVGRAVARELARNGHDVVIVARDERDVDAVARDLGLRFGVDTRAVACDLTDSRRSLDVVREAERDVGGFDAVLFPVGHADDADLGGPDVELFESLVNVNFASVAMLASHFLGEMMRSGHGSLVGFGSVAAVRGRGRNVAYAASKRALVSYFESLRHLASGTGVCVTMYQLGYVDTQASFGRAALLPAVAPDRVARTVVARLRADRGTVYLPRYWRPVSWLVRSVPSPLFRRLSF